MSRTRAALTALVLLSTLALGGCSGDDPQPKFSPPASTSPAAPSTSAESQFIEAYFGAISDSLSTGDPEPFLAMSAESCVNCRVIAGNVRKAYADGGQVKGARWDVGTPSYAGEDKLGRVWNTDVRTAREQWFDADGTLVKTVGASVQHFGVALVRVDGGWKVRELRASS